MKKIDISKMESISGGLALPCFAVGLGVLAGITPIGLFLGVIPFLSDDIAACWNS